MKLTYINTDNKYSTIRQILNQEFNISSRFISKLKKYQAILLNGKPMFIDKEIKLNDEITVNLDIDEESTGIVPVQNPFDIIYEDDAILVINKPYNMPVHPSSSHFTDTLANAVQFYYNEKRYKNKIHLVNRLDKDTSGIVVFAKNGYIKECLIDQMRNNLFHKEYIAFVDGVLEKNSGIINASISRKPGSIIEREVNVDGDIAITHFEKISQYKDYTMVRFILETGRTHQIRVHCKYIGHPILR